MHMHTCMRKGMRMRMGAAKQVDHIMALLEDYMDNQVCDTHTCACMHKLELCI